MRKLTSFLFASLDGVVEAPNRYVRDDLYGDLLSLIRETLKTLEWRQSTLLPGNLEEEIAARSDS